MKKHDDPPTLPPADPITRERLAKLEAERAIIVAALAEFHHALDSRLNAAVAAGKLVGAVEAAMNLPWQWRMHESTTPVNPPPAPKVNQKNGLLNARQLAEHLRLPFMGIYRFPRKEDSSHQARPPDGTI